MVRDRLTADQAVLHAHRVAGRQIVHGPHGARRIGATDRRARIDAKAQLAPVAAVDDQLTTAERADATERRHPRRRRRLGRLRRLRLLLLPLLRLLLLVLRGALLLHGLGLLSLRTLLRFGGLRLGARLRLLRFALLALRLPLRLVERLLAFLDRLAGPRGLVLLLDGFLLRLARLVERLLRRPLRRGRLLLRRRRRRLLLSLAVLATAERPHRERERHRRRHPLQPSHRPPPPKRKRGRLGGAPQSGAAMHLRGAARASRLAATQNGRVDLPPELERIVEGVLASGRRELSLDELADLVFHERSVGYGEIERLIDAFEERGVSVGASPPRDDAASELLAPVLSSARALQGELGRAPTAEEIAARAGLDAGEVKRALAFARTLATQD